MQSKSTKSRDGLDRQSVGNYPKTEMDETWLTSRVLEINLHHEKGKQTQTCGSKTKENGSGRVERDISMPRKNLWKDAH
jgi:hypothetical protein